MKKLFVIILINTAFTYTGFSQAFPFGTSLDSIDVEVPVNCEYSFGKYKFYIYKPINYNANSPALWYVHGTGGNGSEGITMLQDIADRNNAMIIAPTMHNGLLGWAYVITGYNDTLNNVSYTFWSTEIFKQMYRYIEQRENRVNTPVYLTGFSQGAQFTTRYMLIRQFDPDSIPIKMSVSVNPANYTFCTDTFMGTTMDWVWYRCGLDGLSPIGGVSTWEYIPVNKLICNSHVKQYYNENYGVMIGTADTVDFTSFCPGQGADRYERALNFYAFSDSNAVNRGTSLQWQYAEVPNVAHDAYAMYNNKSLPTDTVSIFEQVMFHTPYHSVPDFTPVADFSFMSSLKQVQVTDLSSNADNIYWDFGDGYTTYSSQTNVLHDYADYGTYTICQAVGDSCISDTICKTVTLTPVGIEETKKTKMYFYLTPNPVNEYAELNYKLQKTGKIQIELFNNLGQKEAELFNETVVANNKSQLNIYTKHLEKGIYYIILRHSNGIETIKMIK
jgi:PKD repeat protein